jgi:dUTP pyrophosphatase
MSEGASGMDLTADIESDVVIAPAEIKLISTGVSVAIPSGYEAQIRPRSGLALKHGISLVNTPGTIDSDYRGVISLIVVNLGKEPYVVKRGARMAQMVIQEVVRAEMVEVEDLTETARAHGGFGHTGV